MVRLVNCGGRNNSGKIIFTGRGGGVIKKFYPLLSPYHPLLIGVPAYTIKFSNNSSRLLLVFKTGFVGFWFNSFGIVPGTVIYASTVFNISIGRFCLLGSFPPGTSLHGVGYTYPVFGRSSGALVRVVSNQGSRVLLRLSSGQFQFFSSKFWGGYSVHSENQPKEKFNKAGDRRLLGFRPIVRGVAKNPVDHPHGGGGGKPSSTPYGKPTKGLKTRSNYRTSKYLFR